MHQFFFAALGFVSVGLGTVASAQSPAQAQQSSASGSEGERSGVKQVADGWLISLDRPSSKESWQALSKSTSARMEESQWQTAIAAARQEFGAAQGRTFRDMTLFAKTGNADGVDFYLIEYNSVSAERGALREIVRVVKDSDGTWRVAGYTVEPKHQGGEDDDEK